jgi:hypothetical protein
MEERERKGAEMEFRNSTELEGEWLRQLFLRHSEAYRHNRLSVSVRYSRGADFSGTCFYRDARIFVNLGRHVRYPYSLGTQIARAQSNRTHWWRETYRLSIADPYQLALFVYLHELYHYLVKTAGRSPRRKESRCDRFATRVLVDDYGARVTDGQGRLVAREAWDFQDLETFVAKARRAPKTRTEPAARVPKPKPQRPDAKPCPAPQAPQAILHPSPKAATSPHPIPVIIRGVADRPLRQGYLFEL